MRRSPVPLAQIISSVLIAGILVTFSLYVLYQARFILTGPVVTLTESGTEVTNERVVAVAGTARNITDITVNGRPIMTDEQGYFLENIILENGYTIVSVTARDRYGRTTTARRSFVYRPQSALQ